jgi:hypothetical protein
VGHGDGIRSLPVPHPQLSQDNHDQNSYDFLRSSTESDSAPGAHVTPIPSRPHSPSHSDKSVPLCELFASQTVEASPSIATLSPLTSIGSLPSPGIHDSLQLTPSRIPPEIKALRVKKRKSRGQLSMPSAKRARQKARHATKSASKLSGVKWPAMGVGDEDFHRKVFNPLVVQAC